MQTMNWLDYSLTVTQINRLTKHFIDQMKKDRFPFRPTQKIIEYSFIKEGMSEYYSKIGISSIINDYYYSNTVFFQEIKFNFPQDGISFIQIKIYLDGKMQINFTADSTAINKIPSSLVIREVPTGKNSFRQINPIFTTVNEGLRFYYILFSILTVDDFSKRIKDDDPLANPGKMLEFFSENLTLTADQR